MKNLANHVELKVPPPVVTLLVGAAMWAASHAGPSFELPLLPRVAAFVSISLVGGVVAVLGSLEFRRAGTTMSPVALQASSVLVTSGIYRRTRNPMYLGLALGVLGWAAFLGSIWALAGTVLFVAYITRFQIVPEERVLSAKFGADYAEYRSRVRRWL